ncbi:MAG: AMIN domain-containing protein, partial [Gemmatimonadota bacterium]|nr:AMIN domain-containing protein [Gemmatimonadota bacterium]
MKNAWIIATIGILGFTSGAEAGPGDVTAVSVLPGSGSAVIVIDVAQARQIKDFTLRNPDRLVLDVEGAQLRIPGAVYDGVDRGGILHVRYSQFTPDVVRIVVELDYLRDYQLEYVDNTVRVALSTDQQFTAWSSGGSDGQWSEPQADVAPMFANNFTAPPQQVSQHDRITVTWDDASIEVVMAGFGAFSGRSIIIGAGVQANITARIVDQPWDLALQQILDAHGLLGIEDSQTGVLRIEDPATIAARDTLEPRETVLMQIRYKRAPTIASVLQSVLAPRGGTVIADTSTNQILITDNYSKLPDDTLLVRQLDRPTPQVSIQAKLIFVDRTDIEQLGIRYDLGDDNQFFNQLVQRPDPSTLTGVDTNGDGVDDAFFTQPYTSDVRIIDLGGNSLAAMGNATQQVPSSALSLIFSTALGGFDLTTFVEALQQVELADLQAEPQIATVDNSTAEMFSGERTPIRVIDQGAQQGGGGQQPVATIQFEETGIRLEVTPLVTNTGQVLMQVVTENSSIREAPSDVGFTLQTQRTTNEILVQDGETAVIGGLRVTQVTVAKSGIPLLVDLPILGRIFGFTSRREQRRDLLILITPTVIDADLIGG